MHDTARCSGIKRSCYRSFPVDATALQVKGFLLLGYRSPWRSRNLHLEWNETDERDSFRAVVRVFRDHI